MRLLYLFLIILLPVSALAQGAATLVADNVQLNGENQLIATGNIEVLFDGSRLTASQIVYDQEADSLQIDGPIFLKMADGTILLADRGTLDPRLENGILQSARLVLDQELQLAANQIDRREGRYSQLYKTSATSCRVCGTRAPLWEIRAARVVHDMQERQLYFENATFRVRGIPIFWLPRMRLPDPTLERTSGFLIPIQSNTTQLDTGIKMPYFVTLGDHRDITITPYLSSQTRTLELLYRQAFVHGNFRARGAVSDDTLETANRSYIFAAGNFDLGNEYKLNFDIEAVSDPAYLLDYGYSGKDRLDSGLRILRVTDDTLFLTRLTYYETLREDESNASLPTVIADLSYETRWQPAVGGVLTNGVSFDTAYRYRNLDGDAGRDVSRAGVATKWQNTWTLPAGFVAEAQVGLRGDFYFVNDATSFARNDSRIVPQTGLILRWPLGRTQGNGTTHLIEPTHSLTWADSFGGTPPNEDSTRTELDRANLSAISRHAGDDAVESGAQAAAGLTWTRYGATGVTTALSFGRVIRAQAQSDFTASSGLDGSQSDWLLSAQLTAPGGFIVDARSLWEDTGALTVADSRLSWSNNTFSLAAAYIWQAADDAENRPDTLSAWTFDSRITLSETWTLALDGRYNVAEDRPVQAGAGLRWRNECVTIDVSASRRYTSSSTVEPTTTYGLSASIGGFSAGRAAGGVAASCRN